MDVGLVKETNQRPYRTEQSTIDIESIQPKSQSLIPFNINGAKLKTYDNNKISDHQIGHVTYQKQHSLHFSNFVSYGYRMSSDRQVSVAIS